MAPWWQSTGPRGGLTGAVLGALASPLPHIGTTLVAASERGSWLYDGLPTVRLALVEMGARGVVPTGWEDLLGSRVFVATT